MSQGRIKYHSSRVGYIGHELDCILGDNVVRVRYLGVLERR